MTFAYKAYNREGKAVDGTLTADDAAAAGENLRRQGLFVLTVTASEAVAASTTSAKSAAGRVSVGYRLRCVSMFARQLHVLVDSGTQLAQALSAIERQTPDGPFKQTLVRVGRCIDEGAPLSEAMRRHPAYFDSTCQSLAAAGEASGNMPAMLYRLAEMTRKQLVLRNTLLGALAYPCVLILIGLCVLAMMLLFVLPRFEGLFEQLDTPLPITTRLLVAMSHLLIDYWWSVLPGIGVAAGVAVYWLRSASGKTWFDRIILRAPKIGVLTRSIMTARLARTLGTLLESRVPLVESLQLTRSSMPNQAYAALLARAEEAVGRGEPMTAVLGAGDLLSACVQEAMRNGEQSGKLGAPLVQMANFLEEENELVIKSITRLLEPLILSLLGVLVGFIAISMFLPLFDLVAAASGGGH